MKKSQVRREIGLNLNGKTVTEAIELLELKGKSMPDNIWVEIKSYEEYGECYSKVSLVYYSEETDIELEKRLNEEKRIKDYRKNLYNQLKKEFEGQ